MIKIIPMFKKNLLVLLVFLLSCLNVSAFEGVLETFETEPKKAIVLDKNSKYLAFDLDETLIASDRMTKEDISTAKRLGYKVNTSLDGQQYVIRPGAIEILEYAKRQGFNLMIFTNNKKSYAKDILGSSGLAKYFDKVIANEDVRKPYNRDFALYPNHRNNVHPQQKSKFKLYTVGVYKGYVKRSFQHLTGNKNIHPYMPRYYNAKYPPIYGARVLIDNSAYNVDAPLDFVGIKVPDFLGLIEEPRNPDNSFVWVENLKKDIYFLKEYGWVELYRVKYKRAPENKVIQVQACLEKSSKYFLYQSTVSFFGKDTAVNDLYLSIG